MQPLLLMKQTLDSDVVPAGPFLLTGPYTRYTETKQFLSRSGHSNGATQVLDLEFGIGINSMAGLRFGIDESGQFDVLAVRGSRRAEIEPKWLTRNTTEHELRTEFYPWKVLKGDAVPFHLRVEKKRYSLGFQSYSDSDPSDPDEFREHEEISILNHRVRALLYVPGFRGDPQRKRDLLSVPKQQHFGGNIFEGHFESYIPSLIDSWRREVGSKSIFELVESLDILELATNVATERPSESEVEVRVPRTAESGIDDYVNVADVGLAVSAVLPVLVALIQAERDQLVYIEHPELHLHPKAQIRVALLLVKAANRGVRVVIETHSSLLLRGILTEVAKGAIANDKVMLHWFERDKTTGISKVTSKEPDAAGRVGDWPEDFSDVELSSDNDYLSAVEGNLFAAKK